MFNKHRLQKALICFAIGGICHANADSHVGTHGGLHVGKKTDPYWFEIEGILKLDQRVFSGDNGSNYKSGAQVRSAGLDFSGGIGKNYSYTLGLAFDSKASEIEVEEAFVTYSGLDRWTFSAGQVNPGFCLENTGSSKWTPFLEKSMSSSALSPCPGLGVSTNKWGDSYSVTVAVTQPKANSTVYDTAGSTITRSDLWNASGRITFAPIKDNNNIIQVGISGEYSNDGHAGVRFSSAPEAKARNTTTLLNTGRISAKNHYGLDFEISAQRGPWFTEVEFQNTFVQRGRVLNGTATEGNGNVKFNGYHVLTSYVLTGESKKYKSSNGSFGQIIPKSDKGAVEIAARYSFLNLVDKDVKGGSAHNMTLGLNWYANSNIRVAGEAIRSLQKAHTTLDKKKVNSFGLRMQVVF